MMYNLLTQFATVNFIEFFRRVDWLNILIIIVVALIVLWIARRVVDDFVRHFVKRHKYASKKERQQRSDTLIAVFTTVITVLITVIAFSMVLVQLGVDLAAVAASFGALGVVLGIAGQSLFKSIFRGMIILMGNQMRIGDIVMITGVSGVVEQLNLLNTRLRDLDGTLHIVPNGEIIVLTNYSMGFANVNLDVRVSYEADIDQVVKVINQLGETMAQEDNWKDIIKTPIEFLRVDSFGESAVNIKALGEVTPGEQWGTAGEFRKRLLKEFAKQGIEIPLPQRIIQERSPKSTKS